MFDWLSFDLIAALTTAILLGGMVYFAAVFAPLVFRHLPGEIAGGFIRRVFPVYYLAGLLLAAVAGLLALPGRPMEGGVLLIVAAGFLFARQVLMPRINRARDAGGPADGARFSRLHGLSVAINTVQLLAAAAVLVALMTGL